MRVAAIIGKGKNCPPEVCHDAYEAGFCVGELGFCVVTGGLGGVMDLAAMGATDAGGLAIGLVPCDAWTAPSENLTVALNLGLSTVFRNVAIGCCADVGIILPGSHGTVQEAMVMVERGVPLVAYGNHGDYLTSQLTELGEVQVAATPGTLAAFLARVQPRAAVGPMAARLVPRGT